MLLAGAILGLVTLQRLGELVLSRRNTERLLAQGAREAAPGHYPLIVALHGCWQTPEDFALGTRLNDAADARGLVVVYPGERRYSLGDHIEVVPLAELVESSGAASPFKKRRG